MATEVIPDESVDAETLSVRIERAKVRRRRGWRIAGAIAAGTIALLVGAYFVLDFVDRLAGEAAIERVREAGDPVTPEELAEFYASSSEIERATEHWKQAFEETKGLAMPIISGPKAALQFDARGFYSSSQVALNRPFLEGPAEQALREIRLARETGAVGRFPDSLDESDFEKATAHLESLQGLKDLLSLQREVQEAENDFDGAAETLLDMVAVSEALRNEPTGISFLKRASYLNFAAYDAFESLGRCPYDEDQLRAVQLAYERQDLHVDLLCAMRGEQSLVLQMYDRALPDDPDLERVRNLPFRGADRAKAVDWYQAYLTDAEGGWAEMVQATDDANANLDEMANSRFAAYRYAMAAFRMHYPAMLLESARRAQTDVNVIVALTACRRYRLANAEWPESLEALIPEYLSDVPIDPIAIQPLLYERVDDTIRFRTQAYTTDFNYMKLPHLDSTGRHVFDAATFESAE